MTSSTLDIFRNATFSEAHRNELSDAADLIANVAKDVSPESATQMWPLVDAIRHVVERWDANDETECLRAERDAAVKELGAIEELCDEWTEGAAPSDDAVAAVTFVLHSWEASA